MSVKLYAFADEAGAKISEQIAAMRRNGLAGVELRNSEFGNVSDLSVSAAKEIKSMLDAEGLEVWSLGSPLGKVKITDTAETEFERTKHTVELAKIFGTQNIRMFSFYLPRGAVLADYRSEVIDRLSRMAEIASDAGVKLCHENEKGIWGEDAVHCRDILDSVPEIDGVFDPANFVQCHVETLTAWELLKDRIKYLHIKDALVDGKVVPAGCGIGNVAKIITDYVSRGGSAMTLEPHLTVFKGLEALEQEGGRSQVGEVYTYPDANAAFDAAVSALKAIIA